MTRRAEHLLDWARSSEWRQIASRQAHRNLTEFALRPRCGAKCRTTGAPCRNPVVSGRRRCRLHSGTVGRGDNWHKPVWPDRASKNAVAKLNRKLVDLQRAADRRRNRIARMSPDHLSAYRKWQREHEPTSAIERARKKELRRQNRDARESVLRLTNAKPAKSPELIEIEEKLTALKAELAAPEQPIPGGVFD